ncbi:hypothetical protein [Cypionkella sp.]|uniref:hypothetical protein n=1 Tax=Cypionkella sp. TaxID=2811411 RepID=UPI002FDE5C59
MNNLPNIYLNDSRPLDVHRWSDYPEVNSFIDRIYSSLPAKIGNTKIRKKHFKVLLLDLYVAWTVDPDLKLAVSRDNNRYKAKSRYNELHISKVMPDVVDMLEDAGLVHTANGFFDHVKKIGRVSRVWATGRLAKEFNSALHLHFGINNLESRECIILRDEKKKDIEYEDTKQTDEMRSLLRDYNALLAKTHIDIDYLDKPFLQFKKPNAAPLSIAQSDKFVRRIFNNRSWTQGGRFYGGWWQRCPKAQRNHICMDCIVTQEVDYSGLHIALLYALQGIDYWATIDVDPYLVDWPEGIDPAINQREATKKLLLTAINADTEEKAFKAFRSESASRTPEKKLTDEVLGKVMASLKVKHALIANKIASGAGIDLMYIDSQITERLIAYFTKRGVPMLSIHDSYVVPFGYDNDLIREMKAAFCAVTQVQEVRLKHTTINSHEYFWADRWTVEQKKAQGEDFGEPSQRHKDDLALFKRFHKLPEGYPEWTHPDTALY